MNFAPLHIVSGYSFLKSGLTVNKIQKSVKENDYFGAAICDEKVLYGVPEFIKAMDEINKPYLIGMQLELQGDFLGVYATSEAGYRTLCKISSFINDEDRVNDYLKKHREGLVGIIQTRIGKFNQCFLDEELPATTFCRYLLDISHKFERFYLGIEVLCKEDVHYANKVRKFAAKYLYETIAYPTIRYQYKEDAIIVDIVNAIANEEKITHKEKSGPNYFMKESDYGKIYSKSELFNTIKVIQLSSFSFHNKRGELLHYFVDDPVLSLKEKVYQGLQLKGKGSQEYLKRADYEIKTIIDMGFADYFLIVQDYVSYAETHDILVGPGRGSAAGSLVSYALNITKVDPIQYGLQFERFLNPGRKSMPDIDVDFMDTRREDMIQYMREKYGENRVGQIITYQTIMAKQAIRDIGRIYDYHDWLVDNLSKAITDPKLSINKAYKVLPAFKKLIDSDNYYKEIASLARKIENLPRQSGLHAAGIILNNAPLEDSIPVSIDVNGHYISQYEAPYLEEQGLLKMDFLALKNLTTIDVCVKLINSRHPEAHIDVKNIDFDKAETYQLISNGDLTGIFQLESEGMRKAVNLIQPTRLEDVIAVISLFRPGPMASIPNYARRKNGKEPVQYIAPGLEDILQETYGIIVYQEQISSIAMKMAGFSLSEADLFRRAVSKKKIDDLSSLEQQFIKGSTVNGYSHQVAKKVFDAILKFANYGFNKSHSAVYAYIACEMAYLKAHYPLEFYNSIMLTSSSSSDNKFSKYVLEMKKRGIPLFLPDINNSEKDFIIYNDGLIYPLGQIRGINYLLVDKILEERKANGLFKDFFNFVLRLYPYHLSLSNLEHLIHAGVFDSFNPSRASLLASCNKALQYAELNCNSNGQMTLDDSLLPPPELIDKKDDPLENLNLEYEALGIMLSDDPLKYYQDNVKDYQLTPLSEVNDSKATITVFGMIKSIKVINTKKGAPMAFITLFDQYGELEITIFSDLYSENMAYIKKNQPLLVEGSNKTNKGEISFIANMVRGI